MDPKPNKIKKAPLDSASFAEGSTEVSRSLENGLGIASIWEAITIWPYASLWAVASSSTMILVAYCPSWLTMLFSLPGFTSRVGSPYQGSYIIPADWQSEITAGVLVGQFIGACLIPDFMDKYGRKPSFIAALALSAAAIFSQFFADSLKVTLIGGVLVGITLGALSVLAITYALEVSPYRLQNLFSAIYSTGIVLGPFIAAVISVGVADIQSRWSYRIGYIVQWIWPVLLIPLFVFAPESPVWLIREGRMDEAARVLRRLAVSVYDIGPTLTLIQETDHHEREVESSTRYIDLLRGVNLRRTVIAIAGYTNVVVTGTVTATMISYFMTTAGLDATLSFDMSMGSSGAALLGSFVGIVLVTWRGHNMIFFASLVMSAILWLIIGGLQCVPDYYSRPDIIWAQAALMAVFSFIWGSAICPIGTVIMALVGSTRLRSKTIAVASAAQFGSLVICQVVMTYLLNPDGAALQGYVGFIQGGFNLLVAIWVYFYIPDTNRPTSELDILFARKVAARHFATYGLAQRDPS